MTKRLTASQKAARVAINAAAKQLIDEVDKYPNQADSFVAYFHLDRLNHKTKHLTLNNPIYTQARSTTKGET
jgi:S-adenosylhomocysteine hydrolase